MSLLELVVRKVPVDRKRVLKDALRGISELHEHRIFHTGISPSNILVELKEDRSVEQVDIADLEETIQLPPDLFVQGLQLGHPWWRSLELHVGGPASLPSDIFSFGATCMFTILEEFTFTYSGENTPMEDSERVALREFVASRRQVAVFGEKGGLDGFLDYLPHPPPEYERIRAWLTTDTVKPSPFSERKYVDPVFKDLIGHLMNLDPRKRLTAPEALEHEWFQDV